MCQSGRGGGSGGRGQRGRATAFTHVLLSFVIN